MMALFWTEDQAGHWQPVQLSGDVGLSCGHGVLPVDALSESDSAESEAIAICSEHSQGDRWVLLAEKELSINVNERQLFTGIRVLTDRDVVRLFDPVTRSARRFYFSTERLAEVEPYSGHAGASCPRCKDTLTAEMSAVRCPACGVWHHQCGELSCWTYGDLCASCHSQKTDLEEGFRWSPEDL